MSELPESVSLVNKCCIFLIKTMLETNAEEMKLIQEGFHDKENTYGDFEIIVRKIIKSKPLKEG